MKSKTKKVLLTIVALFIGVPLIMGIISGGKSYINNTDTPKEEKVVKEEKSTKYEGLSKDQETKIDEILSQCKIDDVESIDRDEGLDNAHFEGETGYRIKTPYANNIILYLDKDKNVNLIRYMDIDLYADKEVKDTMDNYFLTTDEATNIQIKCQNLVKQLLKAPKSAKFPNILNWEMAKNKNKITAKSYVDAQNGFGAEIRNDFQITINTDTDTVESFILNGEEQIKK